MAKDLVQLIRDNPGAVFTIDNDCWWMKPARPENASEAAMDAWFEADPIANDGDVIVLGDGGYGSGCSYGGDVLQALAVLAGVTVESV